MTVKKKKKVWVGWTDTNNKLCDLFGWYYDELFGGRFERMFLITRDNFRGEKGMMKKIRFTAKEV